MLNTQLHFSQRGRKATMAFLGCCQARILWGGGKINIWPSIWDPLEGRTTTPVSPLPGPCTYLSLDHWGALSCQCWAGGTQCWAQIVAPCHQQESANRGGGQPAASRWPALRLLRMWWPGDRIQSPPRVGLAPQWEVLSGVTPPGRNSEGSLS